MYFTEIEKKAERDMKDVQKPDHMSLNALISRLKEGRFVIPDFQRDFEWKPWDIRDLMRSIFLDYYIGSLLLWKGKKENFNDLSCEILYGYNNTTGQIPWDKGNGHPEYIVLDGQQRLTALYYTFVAPNVHLPNRSSRAVYFIHVDKFMNEQYDEAFQYDWLTKRFKRILENPEIQFSEHFFPLSIIGKGGWDLYEWVKNYEDYWKKVIKKAEEVNDKVILDTAKQHACNAKLFGEHLKGITEEYQIAFIELDKDLAIDKVCDIFTQINSRGVRLDVFDLINALLKPKGLQLKHLWREASAKFEFVDTEKMNVYILQVMSILSQAYCSPKYLYYLLPGQQKQVRDTTGARRVEVLIKDTDEFKQKWDEAIRLIENAIMLLEHPQEYGVISSRYLPYVSIIPVFSAAQSLLNLQSKVHKLKGQKKFRQWYWASVFTNRYSGSVESTSARDYLDLKAWLEDDALEPSVLMEFKSRFRNLDLRKEIKRGTSVYNGIFNLLVINGARDWFTGTIPQNIDVDDHHIVPTSWGKQYVKGNLINTILNRSPLSSDTNRKIINDKLPNQYLPELIEKNGKNEVESLLISHFISPKALEILLKPDFNAEDFDDFISERQKTIQEAIEDLLIKERIDLSPQLRELDKKVEEIELNLRKIITKILNNDISKIPQHINQKAIDRIQKAAQKNPAFDVDNYQILSGILEFFDFREIQDTIVSRVLWSEFEFLFINKDSLIQKFNQLIELRNGIRHSRSIDDIVKREGDAAIIWFNRAIEKFFKKA